MAYVINGNIYYQGRLVRKVTEEICGNDEKVVEWLRVLVSLYAKSTDRKELQIFFRLKSE